jgi:hypothetical protein
MKVPHYLLVMAAAFLMQPPCQADGPGFAITSPDHPPVWYNRSGDKLSQYLEWSRSKEQLVLHVAYANVGNTSAVWRNQSYADTFELSFPAVHLDSANNRLYVAARHGHTSTIGHLEPGVFGDRVVLEHHLELSAHRQNGVIKAAINSAGSANDKP